MFNIVICNIDSFSLSSAFLCIFYKGVAGLLSDAGARFSKDEYSNFQDKINILVQDLDNRGVQYTIDQFFVVISMEALADLVDMGQISSLLFVKAPNIRHIASVIVQHRSKSNEHKDQCNSG